MFNHTYLGPESLSEFYGHWTGNTKDLETKVSLEDYDTLCGYCSDDLGTGVEKFSVSKFLKSYCLIKSSKVDFWCVGGGSFMGKTVFVVKLIFIHCSV